MLLSIGAPGSLACLPITLPFHLQTVITERSHGRAAGSQELQARRGKSQPDSTNFWVFLAYLDPQQQLDTAFFFQVNKKF